MTIQNVLHKGPKWQTYKIQILHEIKGTDGYTRVEFANYMLTATDKNDNLPTFQEEMSPTSTVIYDYLIFFVNFS
jgi:hypothetical protein